MQYPRKRDKRKKEGRRQQRAWKARRPNSKICFRKVALTLPSFSLFALPSLFATPRSFFAEGLKILNTRQMLSTFYQDCLNALSTIQDVLIDGKEVPLLLMTKGGKRKEETDRKTGEVERAAMPWDAGRGRAEPPAGWASGSERAFVRKPLDGPPAAPAAQCPSRAALLKAWRARHSPPLES